MCVCVYCVLIYICISVGRTYSGNVLHVYKYSYCTRTSSLPKRVTHGSCFTGQLTTPLYYTLLYRKSVVTRRVYNILLYCCCCVKKLSDYETIPLRRPELPVPRLGDEIRGSSLPVQSPVLIFRLAAELSERRRANER